MIILGSVASNKTDLLVEKYVQLIQNGVSAEKILFITLNAYKKAKVTKMIKAFCPKTAPFVQTFLGLCYNTILDNQNLIKEKLPKQDSDYFSLCGLEVSQNLLLEAVREVGFKDYNSKINLVHQLLRRHALIVGNNLTPNEIEEKSKILNESFAKEAQKALDIFKSKTLERRAFDYLRQQSLFKWLYENTNCLNSIEHIIIDDYDEQTPACADFFEHIKPGLKSFAIALDTKGSSRCGYLCANTNCTKIIEKEQIIQAEETATNCKFLFKKTAKRLEMLNLAVDIICNLLKEGEYADEISIATPVFDKQLKFVLQNAFETKNIGYQFISGSEKLIEDSLIKSTLSLLILINGNGQTEDASENLADIFPKLLNIPIKKSYEIIQKFKHSKGFVQFDFEDENHSKNYQKFLDFAAKISPKTTLQNQLKEIYNCFVSPENCTETEISNFEFLMKQITDLENTSTNADKVKILKQIQNSIIAENDANAQQLKSNAIIIGTPQKLIDLEIKTKHQIWLDTTDDEWIKQDTGTIYNAWVFAKNWKKSTFTYEDSIKCTQNKAKRQLRKLQKLASAQIFVLSSNDNSLGITNNIGISDLIRQNNLPTKQPKINTGWKFHARDDQKDILKYKNGKMALTAVPGAGKTTVMQALILKLISDGIPAENIFVLTYMESAAKTLKDRLLNISNNSDFELKTLPNISTIHGLALKIIKENANYAKINLDENFEICDEISRQKAIRETIGELGLKYDEFEKYDKAISIAKFLTINKPPHTKELKDFVKFYNLYQQKLAEQNAIDYDDMLLLAVKLLQENPEILAHYQEICQYILEDEAQDSSAIQQTLINLLGGKHANIVRCGDINQAITSTFTNSDIAGFKDFIQNNKSVEMNCSQRCTQEIFELANKLIDISKNTLDTKNAFYDIKMQSVEDKNPTSKSPICAKIFDDENTETTEIISNIKNILNTTPTSSIAILVRNNFQVTKYIQLLKEYGIPTISRSDCLEHTPIFNKILCLLKFSISPWDNFTVQETYKTLFNQKEENIFITNLETPFINTDASSISDKNLISLHWELNYWLNNLHLPFEQLALKIGEYYCTNETEHANLYIISEIIRRFSTSSNSKSEIITKLEQISKRPTIAGLKLFTQDETTFSTTLGGTVQVMTMHKSKGDEFDYVFVPEFTETNLGTELKSIKTGNFISFYEELKSLDKKYKTKNALELKKEILHENLRLLYVVITRAKLKIHFSASTKQKKFGRIRNSEPSSLFQSLLSNYLEL